VVGSIANEIHATQFVLDYANEIKRNSSRPNDVIVDHMLTSGVVRENAMYYNIQNVVVRLQGESDHAVLMNSHYDSVPGSPGGSDDIVSNFTIILK
jgi:acetylornithine deacetylase/succinyl-diaminopimelate desuccinylase-like protein